MMKKLAVILCLYLCCCLTAGADGMPDTTIPHPLYLQDLNLYGKVRDVTERNYAFPNGDTTRALQSETRYHFDGHGKLTSKIWSMYKTDGATGETDAVYYSYDENQLRGIANYRGHKLQDSIALFYNRKGNLLRKWRFDHKGKIKGRVQYTYNKEEQITAIRDKDADNKILGMVKIYYDEAAHRTDKQMLDEHIRFLCSESIITEPDSNTGTCHIMRFLYARQDTCTGMISCITDSTGHEIQSSTSDADKRVTDYRTMEYDDHKNLLHTVIFAGEKLEVDYRYAYDAQGNWIQRTVYHNDMPERMTIRSINYISN